MGMFTTIAAFLLALSILIVVHEFGHYWVARRCGVKVLCFSVGFGRALWSRRFGADATELRIAMIPLGGYVKMLDEREEAVRPAELHRAFNRKTVWQRFAIVAAGPAANFLAAIVIYWALFFYGVPGLLPVLGDPPAGSAAERAGFVSGDRIIRVGDDAVPSWQDFRWLMLQRALERQPVDVEVMTDRESPASRRILFEGLKSEDLEGDLLGALGFTRPRIAMVPVIGQLSPGGAAERAGLRPGDRVVAIDGIAVDSWDALVRMVRAAPGRVLQVRVRREDVDLPPVAVMPDRIAERGVEIGRIGAGPRVDAGAMEKYMVRVSYGPAEGLWKALEKTRDTALFSLRMLWKMVVGEMSLKNLSGPITIADYAGQSAQSGLLSYLLFLALISISLGVLNLLPVPLLDGGHLMYYSFEIFSGKPLPERVMEAGQQVGMALLLMLMAFALYNDIHRLVGS